MNTVTSYRSSRSPTLPVCIPARWAASRFPGKLLQTVADGRTVLETTVSIAVAADLGPVYVLAADEKIEAAASQYGVRVLRSRRPARNGSERIAEALSEGWLGEPRPPRVLNLQGDAVGASPDFLGAALDALHDLPEATLGTVALRSSEAVGAGRVHVRAEGSEALDFSRRRLTSEGSTLLHVGIYAYHSATLVDIAARPMTPREKEESLEQLRWLESGERVGLRVLDAPVSGAHAVDSIADLASPDINLGRR